MSYLREIDEKVWGSGQSIRYLMKQLPIRAIQLQITERMSGSAEIWRQNSQIAHRMRLSIHSV